MEASRLTQNKKFIIAHVSDLHITGRDKDSRYEMSLPHERLMGMNDSFKALMFSKYMQAADHIVVTGDVTDKGDLSAWKKFNKILNDANVADKTSFVIGNHDICELGTFKFLLTKKRKFEQIRRVRTNLKRRLSAISHSHDYPWVKTLREDIVLFGLDSNHAASFSDASNALGELGQRQLSSFAGLLREQVDVPVKIVALHHSPNLAEKATRVQHKSRFNKLYTRYTHEIPQGQRRSLRLLCKSHGVKRIIHGHMHEKDDRTLDVRIVGVPSSTQPVVQNGTSFLHFVEYHITTSDQGVKRVKNVWRQVPIVSTRKKASLIEYIIEKIRIIF